VFGKIARSLAVVAIAAAPFVMSAPAQAANGCTVNNTSTTGQLHGQVHVPTPPSTPTASVHWSNLSCSFVSAGGTVDYSCTITGRCQIYRNGVLIEQCITAGSCSGSFTTNAGDTVTVTAEGGTATAQDRA
jgi:hypothetical protein